MVAQSNVGCEGEDGDEDGSGGPEVHAQGVQVLAASQALQLTLPESEDLGGEVLLPGIEFDDTDPRQNLTDHLHTHTHHTPHTMGYLFFIKYMYIPVSSSHAQVNIAPKV